MNLIGWILAGVLMASGALRAADLSVSGAIAKPTDLSVAELKDRCSASVKTIDVTSRGQTHHVTGVPLLAVLEMAGLESAIVPSPTVAPGAKHPSLRQGVLVRGSDGYAVLFSVAELLPTVGHRSAWIVWTQDDQPIAAEQGPLKLIVPDDAGPARNVRNVSKLEMIDTSAATQPSNK